MKYNQHPVVEKEILFPVSSLSRLIEDPNNPGNKIEFYDLVGEYNIKNGIIYGVIILVTQFQIKAYGIKFILLIYRKNILFF